MAGVNDKPPITEVEESMAHTLSDIATLLERGALTPATAAGWLRHLAAFLRKEDQYEQA